MKKQKPAELILIESLLKYVQNNLDLIEAFIQEVKNCNDPDEQRYQIFQFMYDCFNENKKNNPAEVRKFKQLLRETNAQRYIKKIKQQSENQPVKKIIENMAQMISDSPIAKVKKKIYLEHLATMDIQLLETACQTSKTEITGVDMKYIICFLARMDIKDICLIFNIEAASVRTVRYRIRKKFIKEDSFRTVL